MENDGSLQYGLVSADELEQGTDDESEQTEMQSVSDDAGLDELSIGMTIVESMFSACILLYTITWNETVKNVGTQSKIMYAPLKCKD